MKELRREDGVSNIIEYSIVLPLCLVAVCFLLVVGYYLHQSAVLESAVYRSAIVVQRIYSDPIALDLIDFGSDEERFVGYRTKRDLKEMSELNRDPYRYFDSNYRQEEIRAQVTGKIEAIVSAATLSPVKSIYVGEATPAYGALDGKKDVVSVTQSFRLPGVFKLVGLPAQTELRAQVQAPKTAQTEFVRNAMFVEDLMEELSEKSEAVGKLTQTIQTMFAKIGGFFRGDS